MILPCDALVHERTLLRRKQWTGIEHPITEVSVAFVEGHALYSFQERIAVRISLADHEACRFGLLRITDVDGAVGKEGFNWGEILAAELLSDHAISVFPHFVKYWE